MVDRDDFRIWGNENPHAYVEHERDATLQKKITQSRDSVLLIKYPLSEKQRPLIS